MGLFFLGKKWLISMVIEDIFAYCLFWVVLRRTALRKSKVSKAFASLKLRRKRLCPPASPPRSMLSCGQDTNCGPVWSFAAAKTHIYGLKIRVLSSPSL